METFSKTQVILLTTLTVNLMSISFDRSEPVLMKQQKNDSGNKSSEIILNVKTRMGNEYSNQSTK